MADHCQLCSINIHLVLQQKLPGPISSPDYLNIHLYIDNIQMIQSWPVKAPGSGWLTAVTPRLGSDWLVLVKMI